MAGRCLERTGALLALIRDLLEITRRDAGHKERRIEAIDLSDVVAALVEFHGPEAVRRKLAIEVARDPALRPALVDRREMEQVVGNLLSNAIKYTEAGGQVIVATSLEENGEVVLRIRDTGVGMSEKDLETAMKPFRQVGVMRDRGEGTGLGLPLTKALVEANRATFTITSAPDQGTLVKITFPTTRVLAG